MRAAVEDRSRTENYRNIPKAVTHRRYQALLHVLQLAAAHCEYSQVARVAYVGEEHEQVCSCSAS